jgi:hypothetical protein
MIRSLREYWLGRRRLLHNSKIIWERKIEELTTNDTSNCVAKFFYLTQDNRSLLLLWVFLHAFFVKGRWLIPCIILVNKGES